MVNKVDTFSRDRSKLQKLASACGLGPSSGVLSSDRFGKGFHDSSTRPRYPTGKPVCIPKGKVDEKSSQERGMTFPALTGEAKPALIVTPYMAKKRAGLAKKRLPGKQDVEVLIKFRNEVLGPALEGISSLSKTPVLDEAALDSLGTMVQTHSPLEDTGRCGTTPKLPVTKEIYAYLCRQYFTIRDRPQSFSLPLQRFLGYPFDATLDRMTNTCILTLLSYHILGMGDKFRLRSFYGACREYFGAPIWNSLERTQDKKKGLLAVGSGVPAGIEANSSVSTVWTVENLEMKVRPVRPADKPVTICLKQIVTHMKLNFEQNVPFFITDSDMIEYWAASSWRSHESGDCVVWSQDFSNMDLSATGANVTEDMMCYIINHLGYDSENYKASLETECQMIYGNRFINTNQYAGMFSGHPATSATNFATGICRTLELACCISYLAGFRTASDIKAALWKSATFVIPSDKLTADGGGRFELASTRTHLSSLSTAEADAYISCSAYLVLSFLNYGDDGIQSLRVGPEKCFDKNATYGERADAAAAFCKTFWDSVACRVGREAGLQFLGRKFVDDNGYINPYPNFYTLGRYIIKTFQPEYPKVGDIAYIGHASRLLQLCEPGTGKPANSGRQIHAGPLGSPAESYRLLQEVNKATKRACQTIIGHISEESAFPKWLTKHYQFITAIDEACDRVARMRSMAELKVDLIDTSKSFAETTDDPRAADSLLQLYLQGDNSDNGGIPDYLAALVPLLNITSTDLLTGAAFTKEAEALKERLRVGHANEKASLSKDGKAPNVRTGVKEDTRSLDFALWFKRKFVDDGRLRKLLADPSAGYATMARCLGEVAHYLTNQGFGSWSRGQTFY